MTEHKSASLAISLTIALMVALCRWVPEQLLIGSVWDAQAGIAHMFSLIASAILFVLTWMAAWFFVSGIATKRKAATTIGAIALVACVVFTGSKAVRFYNDHRAIVDASDAGTSTARLVDLADYRTSYFGYELDNRLASNPGTPVALLRKLYARNNLGTLMCLSRNLNTPRDVLQQLSKSPDKWIIKGLAENPSWSPESSISAQQTDEPQPE